MMWWCDVMWCDVTAYEARGCVFSSHQLSSNLTVVVPFAQMKGRKSQMRVAGPWRVSVRWGEGECEWPWRVRVLEITQSEVTIYYYYWLLFITIHYYYLLFIIIAQSTLLGAFLLFVFVFDFASLSFLVDCFLLSSTNLLNSIKSDEDDWFSHCISTGTWFNCW